MKETILVFCAHSDDEVVGVGATIKKFTDEGKNIIVVVFSSGAASQPLIKKDIIISTRKEESINACNILGCHDLIFLNVEDGKIFLNINNKSFLDKIKNIIIKHNPSKIFTHSESDIIHPDHRAVNIIVKKVVKTLANKPQIYTFAVWNPFSIFKRNSPQLYVDISNTFKDKINALKMFKSQPHFIYPLLILVHLKARIYGRQINSRYAEKFYLSK